MPITACVTKCPTCINRSAGMNWRAFGLLLCCLPLTASALETAKDPVPSVMWAFYHKQLLGEARFVFDDRVRLLASSEERRVGTECVRTCRSRWSRYHSQQKHLIKTV